MRVPRQTLCLSVRPTSVSSTWRIVEKRKIKKMILEIQAQAFFFFFLFYFKSYEYEDRWAPEPDWTVGRRENVWLCWESNHNSLIIHHVV